MRSRRTSDSSARPSSDSALLSERSGRCCSKPSGHAGDAAELAQVVERQVLADSDQPRKQPFSLPAEPLQVFHRPHEGVGEQVLGEVSIADQRHDRAAKDCVGVKHVERSKCPLVALLRALDERAFLLVVDALLMHTQWRG